jgi:Icc-related predicted phosphoesterase
MSITLIGDVHGKYDRYHKIIRQTEYVPYSIQIGDFGFKYDTLKNVDSTKHLIMPGNHDNYDICYNYPHFLGDYGYTSLNRIEFFYYRGANSIDRQYRTIGIDWWEEEQVTIDQFMKARELYRQTKPDIVITHDCPEQIAIQMLEPNGKIYQNITGWALQELFNIHQPKMWFFGHWHKSRQIQYGNTKFVCLDELETYDLVKDSY